MASFAQCEAADTQKSRAVERLITKFCVSCHSGDDPNGNVDFTKVLHSSFDVSFDVWESTIRHLKARTMPPADEAQPTDAEGRQIVDWYEEILRNVTSRPTVHRPRRLAVNEFRNTIRSVVGFDLEVAIIEAEQTISEKSLVVKLLPIDPPGESKFKNDTHRNPLTTVAWDQYSYLADAAIDRLFSLTERDHLRQLTGSFVDGHLTSAQAERLLTELATRTFRRPVPDARMTSVLGNIKGLKREHLAEAVKFEIKTMLMSPEFLYRGLLLGRSKPAGDMAGHPLIDDFELAERLSYFLWADMPDKELQLLASSGKLNSAGAIRKQVRRMLQSDKSRSLTDDFASQWLTLQEIEHVSDNVPIMEAFRSQPLDFMHYLFTKNRPLLELVDSDVAFINPHTSRMYGKDSKQLTRYVKQKGIEVEIVPNQMIELKATTERGGILTMPGILAMNRGPIIRGTWILERILGDELPDPPPDVGEVPPNIGDTKLTFRQRFEQHRANPTCAVCHDRIDPLGFALQMFDTKGKSLRSGTDQSGKSRKSKSKDAETAESIDTAGTLPSGESFKDISQLKLILKTSQSAAVVRNIVERTMSYALCRRLTIYDRPTVDSITATMLETDGTWQELFQSIATSLPFRATALSPSMAEAEQN